MRNVPCFFSVNHNVTYLKNVLSIILIYGVSMVVTAPSSAAMGAGTLNSVTITAATLSALPNCLHYAIRGACFWLTTTGATISTPYISHYLPDVVFTVFNRNGDNPWWEIDNTLDRASSVVANTAVSWIAGVPADGGRHAFHQPWDQHVFFKEVDAIGNPALLSLPTTPALLSSVANPGEPYFQSMLDTVLWRGFPPEALLEQAYAVGANITRYIGHGTTVWGGAYPFEGKVETDTDIKAAAIMAQRAANLLTADNSWGHVYQSLPTDCGRECTAATLHEDDDHTQFQLIYPTAETSCTVFGRSMDAGTSDEEHGAYAWVLWRHYEGCIPGEGWYLGKVIF